MTNRDWHTFRTRPSTGGKKNLKNVKIKNKPLVYGWALHETNKQEMVKPAVVDQGQWKILGTVPVEGPSVWLQGSHSASWSLPPCSFNYRAWANSTQEWWLREPPFWEDWCCCKKVQELLIHCLQHRHRHCAPMKWMWGGHQTSWAG